MAVARPASCCKYRPPASTSTKRGLGEERSEGARDERAVERENRLTVTRGLVPQFDPIDRCALDGQLLELW